jgi:uncharacterized protein
MWFTALVMGLAGSLHCAGMCSPLAMTITNMRSPAMTNRLLYNAGRITMYGVLGAIIAALGYVFPLVKFQNLLSVLLGLFLLVMASAGVTGLRIPVMTNAVIRFTGWLKSLFGKFLQNKKTGSLLILGALNGILPCGLTFLALTFCITLASPLDGFIYMLLFGAGTLPVMLGFVSLISIITNKLNWSIKKVTMSLMFLSGILLIARVFMVHLQDSHATPANLVDIVICR